MADIMRLRCGVVGARMSLNAFQWSGTKTIAVHIGPPIEPNGNDLSSDATEASMLLCRERSRGEH
jgi:hypothetical protein